MKKLTLLTTFLAAAAVPSWAAVVFSVTPVATGTANSTTGWGFTATVDLGDTNFYYFRQADYFQGDPNIPPATPVPPAVGSYTDFVGAVGGYFFDQTGVYSPNPFSSTFNANTQSGMGSFVINPGVLNQYIIGYFKLQYDVYDRDPNDPQANQVGGTQVVYLSSDLEVASSVNPVPEPAFGFLTAASLAGLAWFRQRRAQQ